MIKTPETHPDHPVVGRYFAGYSLQVEDSQVYYCDSYDPRIGYWLTCLKGTERKNVSERAIGGTFHQCDDKGDYWYCSQWGTKYPKVEYGQNFTKV